MSAWREHGLLGILEELSSNQEDQKVSAWLQSAAQWSLAFLRWTSSLYESVFPHTMLSSEDLINEFSVVSQWRNGAVRAFAWHPGVAKFALGLCDDSVRIHSVKNPLVPTLKHSQQKRIADMAWKPFSASVLAVACQYCIVVWTVEPSSMITRPSANCAQILQYDGHKPVTGLAWNPLGTLLLSASVASTSMLIWDVALEECIPIRRLGGGGVSLIKWSPDASLLFSATPSTMFRVWEVENWTCETWHNLDSRCQIACWSFDGSVVLFATKNEPIIYALGFQDAFDSYGKIIGGSKAAVPVVDLREVTFERTDAADVKIGGCIRSMDWDANGERLAVTTIDKITGVVQRYVTVFRTRIKPVVELSPCGFITGAPDETPQLVSFQKKCDSGAVLLVCWSNRYNGSTRLQFVPFHFMIDTSFVAPSSETLSFGNSSAKKNLLYSSEPLLDIRSRLIT